MEQEPQDANVHADVVPVAVRANLLRATAMRQLAETRSEVEV